MRGIRSIIFKKADGQTDLCVGYLSAIALSKWLARSYSAMNLRTLFRLVNIRFTVGRV